MLLSPSPPLSRDTTIFCRSSCSAMPSCSALRSPSLIAALRLLYSCSPSHQSSAHHRRAAVYASLRQAYVQDSEDLRCIAGVLTSQSKSAIGIPGPSSQYESGKTYSASDIALRYLDVFGWNVEIDGKVVGKVEEIIHIGRVDEDIDIDIPYEYILKVVGPDISEDATESFKDSRLKLRRQRHGKQMAGIKILIPIVDEFIEDIDVKKRYLLVKPPAGLLELATRPQAIERLQPELEIFCRRYSHLLQERFYGNKKIKLNGSIDLQQLVNSYMPTREQLLEAGRSDLVRKIRAAGGFLYVAHMLGLKTTRRPNGFWDDLEKLDFEIECFLLENWVKQVDAETGIVYFENLVTRQVAVEKPPANTSLRAMPQQLLVCQAGRWDLHHAIMWNGGYREVAQNLGRCLVRRTKKQQQQRGEILNLLLSDHISSIKK